MSAELTEPYPHTRHLSRWWLLRDALLLLGGFAAGGVLCGVLWQWWWTPPTGTVTGHVWYPDLVGLREQFSGTATYVSVAVVAGLLLGALAAWFFDRSELLTLGAVLVGSGLAGWLMLRTGTALAPADPQAAAVTAADGTQVLGTLQVSGRSPFVAFPVGALAGVAAVFVGLTPNRRSGR